MKKCIGLLSLMLLGGCATYRVVSPLDLKSGYFTASPAGNTGVKKANIVKSVSVDLDSKSDLVFVPVDPFIRGMIENIGYFKKTINVDELQAEIVRAGVQDKVPNLLDGIGVNKAYTYFKPFLWVTELDRRDATSQNPLVYRRLVLTDPKTLEELFVAEVKYDFVWSGVNDQSTFYPLYNALIDYIKSNSKSYAKK